MKRNIHSTGIHLSNNYLLSTYYVLDTVDGADDTATKTKDTTNRRTCLRQNILMSVFFLFFS